MTEKRYRIEEMFTNGWQLIDSSSKNLTKEECIEKLNSYIGEGVNPNYLRVVTDDNED